MNIMSLLTPKVTVSYLYTDSTVRQGIEKMKANGYTAIPVLTKDGKYDGTVSEGDFLWHMVEHNTTDLKKEEEFLISDITREAWNPPVKIDETMEELLLRVMDQNFVPVVDDRNLFVGIITRKDVIKYFYNKIKA